MAVPPATKPAALSPRLGGATFPASHRMRRFAWNVVWATLGSWTPAPLHAWRRLLVVLFGGKLAPKARVYGGVRIWYPPNLEMADYACLGPGVDCYCMDTITLGERALVSQRAFLCAGTHSLSDPAFQLITKPIVIEADAWIAAEAFVAPGVRVAEGAVLGARSCAFKDLAPWTVYGGNPAVPLKARTYLGQHTKEAE